MASASQSVEPNGARNKNYIGGARSKNSSGGTAASTDGHAERLASNRSREAERKLSFQGSRFSSDDDAQPLDDIPEVVPEADYESVGDFFGQGEQGEQGELVEAVHPSIDRYSPDVDEPNRPDEVNLHADHFEGFCSWPRLSLFEWLLPVSTTIYYQESATIPMLQFLHQFHYFNWFRHGDYRFGDAFGIRNFFPLFRDSWKVVSTIMT